MILHNNINNIFCIKLSCFVDNCPFSECTEKNTDSSWENEIQEIDDRVKLFKAVKERIQNEIGFTLSNGGLNHTGNSILMFPDRNKDTVKVYLVFYQNLVQRFIPSN